MKNKKNKLFALAFLGVGVLSTIVTKDATVMVITSIIAIFLFTAKRNWIV